MKDKKCKVCQNIFTPVQFAQSVCGYKCAIEHSKNLKQQKDQREWKEQRAILKEKLKTLGQYEADAKKSFQKYVRMRDEKRPCISCGIENTELWDGGHYKKAEIYSGVIFDENNCHKQCRKCNRFLGGNELNYRSGLIQRYGIEYTDQIEEKANNTRNYKFTKEELIAKKLKYDILIKEFGKSK
jgi:hypothetical protein